MSDMKDHKLTVTCFLCTMQNVPTPFTYTSKAISRTKRRNDVIQAMSQHVQDMHNGVFAQLQGFMLELTTICSEVLFVSNCVTAVTTNVDSELEEYIDERIERLIDILGLDEDTDDDDDNADDEDNEDENENSENTNDA